MKPPTAPAVGGFLKKYLKIVSEVLTKYNFYGILCLITERRNANMAFCKNCGAQIADGVAFCANCGQKTETPAPQPAPQPAPAEAPAGKQSCWDGGVLETVAASIVASLIISITCGIGTPWAVCYLYGYILKHVVLDGKRLTFDGTGGQLFGNWIKWFLLMIVTCGIYSFWVIPRLYNWIASHTHRED